MKVTRERSRGDYYYFIYINGVIIDVTTLTYSDFP